MRSLDRILQKVGDRATGYIPRVFRYFSEELKLSVNTKKISGELSISARPKGASKWGKSINKRRSRTYRTYGD